MTAQRRKTRVLFIGLFFNFLYMKNEENKGIALIDAIQKKVAEKNLSKKYISELLEISPSYSHRIFNAKEQWIGSLEENKLKKIADFLDMPLISVYMLAEIIKPDFFYKESSLSDQANLVIEHLINDKRFAAIMPKKELLTNLPNEIKIFIAVLYQEVANLDLLKRAGIIEIEKIIT